MTQHAQPGRRLFCARRSDPPGHPCPSGARRGDSDGTGPALRNDAAGRFPPPEGAGGRGPDHSPGGRHETPLSAGSGRHRRRRPVVGHAAPGLGEELRPAGRCPGHHAAPRTKGPAMSKMTIKTEGDTHVVITRRFAAPPEAVYRAHTEPSLLQKWLLGPDGWTMPVCVSEARPGGKIRYEWTNGEGAGFYVTGEYVELVPFSRLVHVERMHMPDATPDNHVETTFAA